ncbi:hypothetical protein BJV78DRAFT_734558 [Lactifluus subvellereus]|nr:hypothetical protein BJV78DRAFT_734558 [Lactifluus subvellereus]
MCVNSLPLPIMTPPFDTLLLGPLLQSSFRYFTMIRFPSFPSVFNRCLCMTLFLCRSLTPRFMSFPMLPCSLCLLPPFACIILYYAMPCHVLCLNQHRIPLLRATRDVIPLSSTAACAQTWPDCTLSCACAVTMPSPGNISDPLPAYLLSAIQHPAVLSQVQIPLPFDFPRRGLA